MDTNQVKQQQQQLKTMSNDYMDVLPPAISKEIYLEPETGRAFCSVRGLSRLADVSASSLIDSRKNERLGKRRGLLYWLMDLPAKDLPVSLKRFHGFDYQKANNKLPDVIVSAVLAYYAYESKNPKERARIVYDAISAIGLRTVFQKIAEKGDHQEVLPDRSRRIREWKNQGKTDLWIERRLQGIDHARNPYTQELRDRDVRGVGYSQNTNALYESLFGITASDIKRTSNSIKVARDALDKDQLVALSFSEVSAIKLMQAKGVVGNIKTREASSEAGRCVREVMTKVHWHTASSSF